MKDDIKDNSKAKNILNLMKIKEESKEIPRKKSSKKSVGSFFSRYDLDEDQSSKNNDAKTARSIMQGDSMQLYKNKIKQNLQSKGKKENTSFDIISFEPNEKTSDSHTIFGNFKNNKPKMPANFGVNTSSLLINRGDNNNNISKIKKKKKIKKVTFKKKFVSYIDIESYKKYNMDNCILNDNNKADTKCTCVIY